MEQGKIEGSIGIARSVRGLAALLGAVAVLLVGASAAAAAETGAIKGKVTDAETEGAIEGIKICTWRLAEHEGGLEPEGPGYPVCVDSGPEGTYELPGLPVGKYAIEFAAPPESGLNYAPQYDGGAVKFKEGKVVEVAAGGSVVADAKMAKGGEVSGRVTAAASGAAVKDAYVCATNVDFEVLASSCTETNSTGEYLLIALPQGEYEIEFEAEGFEFEYFKDAASLVDATPVKVVPGPPPIEHIDAALEPEAIGPQVVGKQLPIVSGAIAVGSTLSCSQGVWAGTPPIKFSYQWDSDTAPIAGATGTTYTVQPADVGDFIACTVTASNRAGRLSARSIGYRVPPPAPSVPAATASGGVQGVTIVVPSLAATGRLHVVGAGGSVRLHCALGPCRGTVTLLGAVTRHVRLHGHTVTRHLTIVLGSGSFALTQGTTRAIKIRLTAAGRRLLAGAAHHPRTDKLKLALQGTHTTTRAITVY